MLIKHYFTLSFFVLLSIIFLNSCLKSTKPKNVIFFISDGCGYYQKDAASIFEYGDVSQQPYKDFDVKLAMSTYSATSDGYNPDSTWASFEWMLRKPTDSAAAATAMATGIKTYNGMLGMDTNGVPQKTILEYLDAQGKATGVVTSVLLSEATPAAFLVHQPDRDQAEIISKDMIENSTAEVIIACGHPYFDDQARPAKDTTYRHVGGKETWEKIQAGNAGNDADKNKDLQPWVFIETKQQFHDLMTGETPSRVLGIPQVLGTLQKHRSGPTNADPFKVPFNTTVPSLSEMTLAAINVVDDDPDGFFLMIEGGAIDWAGHANQISRLIEEEIDFNQAVKSAIDWVEKNSSWDETLIIVTADHETGYLTGPGSGIEKPTDISHIADVWKPLVNNGKGEVPGYEFHSTHHTNSLVPFYAQGAGSSVLLAKADQQDPVHGKYLDNTEIAESIFEIFK